MADENRRRGDAGAIATIIGFVTALTAITGSFSVRAG
ncbi:hypothetical protein BH11ACT4_BH11ACT4_04760 [soil metagenome]